MSKPEDKVGLREVLREPRQALRDALGMYVRDGRRAVQESRLGDLVRSLGRTEAPTTPPDSESSPTSATTPPDSESSPTSAATPPDSASSPTLDFDSGLLREALAGDPERFLTEVLVPHMAKARWEFSDLVSRAARERLKDDTLWRYSTARVASLYSRFRGTAGVLEGKRTLDFGCGKSNPLALSALFFANGAAECKAVDLSPANDEWTAKGMYELLREALTLPEGFKDEDQPFDRFRERVLRFNLSALREGDLEAGLRATPVRQHVISHEQYPSFLADLDYVFSQSVLEHVFELETVLKSLRAVMKAGAIMKHSVDFFDHRRRRLGKKGLVPWLFLTDNSKFSRTHCNRIRYTEMTEIIGRAGFAIVSVETAEREPPADLRKKLLPQFQHLSDLDLRTVAAHFVLKAV